MPRLPSQLTYNDLNGAEAVECLTDWFRQLLATSPHLQPHLTLPCAKLKLTVDIDISMFVGGTVPQPSDPERLTIAGTVDLQNDLSQPGGSAALQSAIATESQHITQSRQRLSAVVNAAPEPGGRPPDQIRDQHGLPIPSPGYGPRETGSHLFLADLPSTPQRSASQPPPALPLEEIEVVSAVADPDPSGGRRGIVAEGYTFSTERPVTAVELAASGQEIPFCDGEIKIDLAGTGIQHAGMTVKERPHRASVKEFGDQKGKSYSSVNSVYDAGPAGLMAKATRGGGGMGGDGRPRLSWGNNR